MLGKQMEDALNEQVAQEAYSYFQYLAMASWLDFNGYPGSSLFLYSQAEEEKMHMEKLFKYINEAGGFAKAPAVNQPVLQFESYVHVFDSILENEKKITEKIHTLVDNAFTLKDFTTFNFLQWYVAEQLEEENQFRTICDTIQMLVNNSESLYQLDKDLPAMRKLDKLE